MKSHPEVWTTKPADQCKGRVNSICSICHKQKHHWCLCTRHKSCSSGLVEEHWYNPYLPCALKFSGEPLKQEIPCHSPFTDTTTTTTSSMLTAVLFFKSPGLLIHRDDKLTIYFQKCLPNGAERNYTASGRTVWNTGAFMNCHILKSSDWHNHVYQRLNEAYCKATRNEI